MQSLEGFGAGPGRGHAFLTTTFFFEALTV